MIRIDIALMTLLIVLVMSLLLFFAHILTISQLSNCYHKQYL